MELNVRVYNEVVEGGGWYSFKCGSYTVKPRRIIRYPCGRYGAAAKRYYYHCEFIGFGDMLNCHRASAAGELLTEAIIRKSNPKFDPKKLNWVENVAVIDHLKQV